ncbi:unnamed protein product [Triticum turgidum subsp. durum]|uniref:Glycosyl hydrolase family 32 N-terminal domain-containing protein n=1 Tax=Triticum turgidum subsp. durum TaxID=4567 RepID=A0A9R0YYV2_TRITD|nr:unnamed protein product [Triticum turgidum subsp. durum]
MAEQWKAATEDRRAAAQDRLAEAEKRKLAVKELNVAAKDGKVAVKERKSMGMMGGFLGGGIGAMGGGMGGYMSVMGGGIGGGMGWQESWVPWDAAWEERTGYHFQPEKNYQNGPVYYKGWYHFFYQHNPGGTGWGNISWGHAVSRDMVHWRHLPLAMVPEYWYDIEGVLTGSITVLPDGRVILLYTGNTETFAQVTCLAEAADPSDPLLREWVKHPANPVVYPPPGIGMKDYRDPTTAWFDNSDNTWRIIIGSKNDTDHSGIVFTYKTKDFVSYELIPGYLYRGPAGTGMYECIDLFAVGGGRAASDMYNSTAEDVLYVLKESSDDDRRDYYALGRFDAAANTWTPIDTERELGVALRYDYGRYDASKSFYDPVKQRRIVWGYVVETDSWSADAAKGWANLQTSQLDIEASFRINASTIEALNEVDVGYNCTMTSGSATRGALGPFGILVLANVALTEQTAVYFYVSKGLDGGLRTHFCHDELRSTHATDVAKEMEGQKESRQLIRLRVAGEWPSTCIDVSASLPKIPSGETMCDKQHKGGVRAYTGLCKRTRVRYYGSTCEF